MDRSGYTFWSEVDPQTVPLPNGTEVVTRVDRALPDGRVVPQGSLGRVVAREADRLRVRFVAHGELVLGRDELTPRREGQLRFAIKRTAAWQALRPCVVLETVVGSRAWGLAHEGSDVDRRGIFVWPFPWTAGLAEPPSDLVSEDGSETHWEIDKALRQALRCDPNTLETLFVSGARANDPIGAWILEARDAFPSQAIYGAFGRYALSQLKKLEQTQRLADHREAVVGWLAAEPRLGLDEVAERLAETAGVPAASERDARLRAKRYVQQLYRSLYDQGLLEQRDFASLVAFAKNRGGAASALPRTLSPKNAYNLLRLIDAATRWLATGKASLRPEEPLRSELLRIKAGEVALSEVLARAEAMMPALEAARENSALPPEGDVARADALLRRIREEVGRRHFERAPGPLGADAPPLPLARSEEVEA
jgi:hypothetical protein